MMKKGLTVLLLIIVEVLPVTAQNDLLDRLTRQAVEIDSLRKAAKAEADKNNQLDRLNLALEDTLRKLNSDLQKFEKFIAEKRSYDSLLQQKKDSVLLLKTVISEKDKELRSGQDKSLKKATEEYQRGRHEVLSVLLNEYRSRSFDQIVESTTKEAIIRDMTLLKETGEVRQKIVDAEKYLIAKNLLALKPDGGQIKEGINKLSQIKSESKYLDKLSELLEGYRTYSDGLKALIDNLIALDNTEVVTGMSKEIRQKKLDKILGQVSSFIFNYDYNFSDYPYLTNILLELMKRKQPDPDANISDLLKYF